MGKSDPKPWPRLPAVYVREGAPAWSRARFRAVLDSRPDEGLFEPIRKRRRELSRLSPHDRHQSYDRRLSKEASVTVDSAMISIPPRYGALLYALAANAGARRVLEAGSGFGISTMYLAAAVAGQPGNRVFSFEIADYAAIAQGSATAVAPRARVINDSFLALGAHLPANFECDFAFIDSQHDHESIMKTYKTMLGWMAPRHVIVVDDIRYSESSRAAWRKIALSRDDRFVAVVNGRFGVIAT